MSKPYVRQTGKQEERRRCLSLVYAERKNKSGYRIIAYTLCV